MPLMDMTVHQKIFAVIMAIIVFIAIIELLRRRRLKEEYSWLWLVTALTMTVLVLSYKLLLFITHLIGAVAATTTLFIFANLFLLAVLVHYSAIISTLTHQVKDLAQELAILKSEIEKRY